MSQRLLRFVVAAALLLAAPLPTAAQGSSICNPEGALAALIDLHADVATRVNLRKVLDGSPDIRRAFEAGNAVSSLASWVLLFLGTEATILPSNPRIERPRLNAEWPKGIGDRISDSRYTVRLHGTVRIKHPEVLDASNCLGLVLKLAGSGVQLGVTPAGPLPGTDVIWDLLSGGEGPSRDPGWIVAWGNRPDTYTDNDGHTSNVLLARHSKYDLTKVCVEPWEREAVVRLRYRVKARELDIESLLQFTKAVLSATAGSPVGYGEVTAELASRSVYFSSEPVVVTVIDWKPCRWRVEASVTGTTTVAHASGPVSMNSTMNFTWMVNGVQSSTDPDDMFKSVIATVESSEMTGSSRGRTVDRGCITNSSQTVAGHSVGKIGASAAILQIQPDEGTYRLSLKLNPIPSVGTTTVVHCSGHRTSGDAPGETAAPTEMWPITRALDPYVNEIVGEDTFAAPLPDWSMTRVVKWRFVPLGNPAPKE